ncbi:hypothetical protein A2U01_0082491, partial [Trifolium medium]|nr:hypothetical protein [Trifolium medium]
MRSGARAREVKRARGREREEEQEVSSNQ